jgi:holo-[acyl-carrier protein] synthase
MVIGLGNDIIEIERIASSIKRYGNRFLNRIFTPAEQEYCNNFRDAERHFAGRFAAKEAIVKALGAGISASVGWLDIEIQSNGDGKPVVVCSSRVNESFHTPTILVSISHSKIYATAVALWVS